MPTPKSRNYMFTLNNHLNVRLPMNDMIKYMVYQPEVGMSGTPHYQGYVELKSPMRMSAIHKWSGWERVALFPRKGTQAQAIAYCTKSDTKCGPTVTEGEPSKQGLRSDISNLDDLCDRIKDGMSRRDIATQASALYVRHHTGLDALKSATGEQRSTKSIGWIFFGDTNTGKSHAAKTLFPGAYYLPENSKKDLWFDGYDGEETIIIDDFYGWFPMSFMLKFVDGYPQQLPTKGGHIQNTAKNIVFTSNTNPEAWYARHFDKVPGHKDAFMRRFEEIWEFTGAWDKDLGVKKIKSRKCDCAVWMDHPYTTRMICKFWSPLRNQLWEDKKVSDEHVNDSPDFAGLGEDIGTWSPPASGLSLLRASSQLPDDFKCIEQIDYEDATEHIAHHNRQLAVIRDKTPLRVWHQLNTDTDESNHIYDNMVAMEESTFAL